MASVTHPVKEMDPNQNYYGEQKINAPTLQGEADKSFGNFHANLMNSGSHDNPNQKESRMKAMKRRMSKAY